MGPRQPLGRRCSGLYGANLAENPMPWSSVGGARNTRSEGTQIALPRRDDLAIRSRQGMAHQAFQPVRPVRLTGYFPGRSGAVRL